MNTASNAPLLSLSKGVQQGNYGFTEDGQMHCAPTKWGQFTVLHEGGQLLFERDGVTEYVFEAHPIDGTPILRFGPVDYVGQNAQHKVAKIENLLVTGGGSHFAAAEDGTPLHITYVKSGGKYVMKIEEATDAELGSVKREEFKPKKTTP